MNLVPLSDHEIQLRDRHINRFLFSFKLLMPLSVFGLFVLFSWIVFAGAGKSPALGFLIMMGFITVILLPVYVGVISIWKGKKEHNTKITFDIERMGSFRGRIDLIHLESNERLRVTGDNFIYREHYKLIRQGKKHDRYRVVMIQDAQLILLVEKI